MNSPAQSPTANNSTKRVRFSFTKGQTKCDGDKERTKIFKGRRRAFIIQRKKESRRLGKLKVLNDNAEEETADSTTTTKVARQVKLVVSKKKSSSIERQMRRQRQRLRAEVINLKEGWSTGTGSGTGTGADSEFDDEASTNWQILDSSKSIEKSDNFDEDDFKIIDRDRSRHRQELMSKSKKSVTKLSIRRSSSDDASGSGSDDSILSITTVTDLDEDVIFSSSRVESTAVYMQLRLQIPAKNSITTVVVTADKDRPIADISQDLNSDFSGILSDSVSVFRGPVIKDAKVCPKSCKCPPPEVWFKCDLCSRVYDSLEKQRRHRASCH